MFKQSPFCMFCGFLFAPFCESCLFVFENAENIVTYISIHTIQHNFLIQIATIFCPHFFFFFSFALPASWKIETPPNAIDARLVPCMIKQMIS